MTNDIVCMKKITKIYNNKTIALKDIDLNIRANSIIGFIGKNGSGKTTTMKIIVKLIKHYKGKIEWNFKNHTNTNTYIGFSPEKINANGLSTLEQECNILAQMRGVSKQISKKQIDYLFNLFEMNNYRKKYLITLSKGNLQKFSFIQSLLHDPDLLVLDEPTSGIDPISKKKFFDILTDLKSKGKTIIISSHHLDELEKICDYIYIFDMGKVISSGKTQDLIADTSLSNYFFNSIQDNMKGNINK